MSAFDSAFSNAAFADYFSAPVVYRRGAEEISIDAMDSIISTEARLEFGASLAIDAREFVILISEMQDDFVEPERGDEIELETGDIYEVSRVGQMPEWEYDADRSYFRIRALLKEDE